MTCEKHKLSDWLERKLLVILAAAVLFMMIVLAATGVVVQQQLRVTPSEVLAEVEQIQKKLAQKETEAEVVLAALEKSEAAVVGIDTTGKIILWSRGATLLFGFTREDTIGYGVGSLMPVGAREKHQVAFSRAMVGEIPVQNTISCTAMHASGKELPVQISVWGVPGSMAIAVFNATTK